MIKIINNPIDKVIDIAKLKYPSIECSVEFVEGLEEQRNLHGLCEFKENNCTIYVDDELPFIAIVEVLAHELGHAYVGNRDDHGSKWNEVYSFITDEFDRGY